MSLDPRLPGLFPSAPRSPAGRQPGRARRGPHSYRFGGDAFNALVGLLAILLVWAPASGAGAGAEEDAPVVVVLGDSLTAGYGLAPEQAFPARLAARLAGSGVAARVVDAGVSGDTSAGGRARLDWVLRDKPDLVILELGANDALRGIDPAATRANLDDLVARLVARGIRVLLTGMRAPPNLGRDYGAEFDAIYPELAAKHRVALYPFFLDGVAARVELNQADGIHPNARGVELIVGRIAPWVIRLLEGG